MPKPPAARGPMPMWEETLAPSGTRTFSCPATKRIAPRKQAA